MSAEEGGGHDERWVISYADLVTLLLGFFIILFASAQIDQEKFHELSFAFKEAFNVDVRAGADGSSPVLTGGLGVVPGGNFSSFAQPDVKSIRTTFDEQLLESGLTSSSVDILRDGQGVVIRVSDRLLFASASAELNPEAIPLLEVVAGVLRGIESDVRVEGHTDNVPVASERYPTNWELSSARATTVLRFLLDEGVEPRRLVAAGYAEFHPIASNTTPEGRAINRRADIVLTALPARTATPSPAQPSIDPKVTPVTSKGATTP
ncbi:MAG: OmpA family protein [Dehalococcoidia bacterium]|nr:OmpA family protein [Dehalococcoidia bacterium]